jgi:hypothetical protein
VTKDAENTRVTSARAQDLSIGFPSPVRPAFARPVVKSTSIRGVRDITKDTPYVPHLPITLTIPDSLRPFFLKIVVYKKELFRIGAQAGAGSYIQPLSGGCGSE